MRDAPYIEEAERRGTDFMYEWAWGYLPDELEDEEDDDDDM